MVLQGVFQPVELESTAVIATILTRSSGLEDTLLRLCREVLPSSQAMEVERTVLFAKKLKPRTSGPTPITVYFTHPVRVTTAAIKVQSFPNLETILISLLHNAIETYELTARDLTDAGYSDHVTKAIGALTIDRAREKDPQYLAAYYQNIQEQGESLVLIKCLDKLDNLLTLPIFEDDAARIRYLDVAEWYVLPLAHRLSSEFGQYFKTVLDYMRQTGCNRELRQQYDRLLRAQSPVQG